jgi:hypothetical protein
MQTDTHLWLRGQPPQPPHFPKDPPRLTGLIRQFLNLGTSDSQVFQAIVFHRLREIKYPEEEDMLITFSGRTFFCECFCGLCTAPW